MKTITNPEHEALLLYLADNKIRVSAMETDMDLQLVDYCNESASEEDRTDSLVSGIIVFKRIKEDSSFNGWRSGTNPYYGYFIKSDDNGLLVEFEYRTIIVLTDRTADIGSAMPFLRQENTRLEDKDL